MKMKGAGFVKKILSIIGKAKSMADLKNRMRNIKTRFMIYSLLSTDKKVLFGSISHKLQGLIQEQTPSTANQEESTLSLQQLAPVLYNDMHATILPLNITNIDARDDNEVADEEEEEEEEVVIDQNVVEVTEEVLEESNHEFAVSACVDEVYQENKEEEGDADTKMKDAYPDLRQEDDYEMGRPGSVIELVKKTKEAQDGREFKLEDQIDEVADLFIQRFHRHMWMQKQNSFKRRSNT